MEKCPLAIVGMSVLYPGSASLAEYWRGIVEARDHLSAVPPSRWEVGDYFAADPAAADRTYSRRGGFVPDVEFDAIEWGMPPAALASTDPVQLLTLLVARAALLDAVGGRSAEDLDGDRVSVFVGASGATQLATTMAARLQHPAWRRGLLASGIPEARADEICARIADQYPQWTENVFPGYLNNVISGRVANRLGLRGTNCTTDAACASSLAALKMGAQELWLGDSDLVLVGGADALCDPLGYLSFAKCSALSKTDDCRPFSSQADGTVISEGVGMVILERLADAERHGRRIYAVVRGIGSSSDGRGTAIYAPSKDGQALAMRRAYENAGVGPETVELLEAHGTGTPAGEVAEVQAAREVFEASGRADHGWCALGSVKSQIGHTKAAAGVAGLVKAALALHHRVLPPTAKVEQPNPKLDLAASPFHVNTRARPWISSGSTLRRAGVSSFGFGGTNFHVVLEEYRGKAPAPRLPSSSAELLLACGRDRAEAADACARLADAVSRSPGSFPELARDARRSFTPAAAVRVAVVASGAEEIAGRLRAAAHALRSDAPAPAGVSVGFGPHEGRVAFLFPGQGSQYLYMSGAPSMEHDAARAPWDLAATLPLEGALGLHQVVFPAPVFDPQEREAQRRRLTATEWAQPALAAASLAWLALLERAGVRPDCAAGHSFGELVALRAAGVFSDEALLRAARRRGELMRDAARGEGAMTAVSAPLARVEERVRGVDGVVIANHNAPSQVVVSGRTSALETLERELSRAGMTFTRLPVSTAFHSPVVAACADAFREFLEPLDLGAPRLDVFGNTHAAPYPADPAAIRDTLARQLAMPVRFVDQIEAMYAAGVRTFVEVGPKAVLSRFVTATLQGRTHRAIPVDDGSGAITPWLAALGQLAAAGLPVDVSALEVGEQRTARPREGGSKVAVRVNGSLRTHAPGRDPAPPQVAASAPAEHAPAAEASQVLPPRTASRPPPAGATAPTAAAAAMLRRRLIEVHSRYQRAMAEAHMAFVATAESSLRTIAAPGLPAPPTQPAEERILVEPAFGARPPGAHLPAANAPPTGWDAPPAAPVPAAGGAASAPARSGALATLTAVVADKTGFPAEAIRPEMDLERDLGVDSIKRVEILAELRARLPALAAIAPEALAPRRTLAELAALLASLETARPEPPQDALAVLPPPPTPTQQAAAPRSSLLETILAVVADKTGFPPEALRPEMDLQDDLGVDSIKRVEVFVALRTAVPSLGDVHAAELAPLRTISQIDAFLSQRTR